MSPLEMELDWFHEKFIKCHCFKNLFHHRPIDKAFISDQHTGALGLMISGTPLSCLVV